MFMRVRAFAAKVKIGIATVKLRKYNLGHGALPFGRSVLNYIPESHKCQYMSMKTLLKSGNMYVIMQEKANKKGDSYGT